MDYIGRYSCKKDDEGEIIEKNIRIKEVEIDGREKFRKIVNDVRKGERGWNSGKNRKWKIIWSWRNFIRSREISVIKIWGGLDEGNVWDLWGDGDLGRNGGWWELCDGERIKGEGKILGNVVLIKCLIWGFWRIEEGDSKLDYGGKKDGKWVVYGVNRSYEMRNRYLNDGKKR